jgi:transposase InsO family protein
MTAAEIAESLGLALSTVSLWLRRIGLGKRSRLEPPEPPNRYERRHPGELVHVDIKQLGRISTRGAGHRVVGHRKSKVARREGGVLKGQTRFEYVHVMVDDHSRLAYAEVLGALTAVAAIGFLRRAVAWFGERGVRIKAVMTDNGSCYVAHAHRAALRELGLRHLRIRPYGRAPTARPSASSRRSSTNGPGRVSTAARPSARRRYRSSSSATTSDVRTAPSANGPRPRG